MKKLIIAALLLTGFAAKAQQRVTLSTQKTNLISVKDTSIIIVVVSDNDNDKQQAFADGHLIETMTKKGYKCFDVTKADIRLYGANKLYLWMKKEQNLLASK